ncbi:hypothetical protein A2X44_00735 [candidate division CPR3 bacterium GWF2_35_18]|uniref:DUF4145 domain-containing protein n=1 Tax=candidate division CPR3 bacterium GW2011_GWF2_35_18 TaxID=1618350 RepID=A0A0G0E4F1_UNCC3|nr:MAG: hypothetical protein UR67_C0001G0129 [candidate division CPR3 bacterium GW2011_GWF2_35_18]OGB63436.1 MAG: hypothetical protein A2X44_00735 [candidate division CPR3 bacterium GWF2_35_18]OGB64819.1 MAG: hypothetical protein A2250_05295 [candidate division CPR3 bacterium RIFOXYA2_FULL_35_13]OGB76937.1 MAG: hypothetical protein A2476_05115 [candidate division CPR3 bacterium RIFOXYC2_FULL_35_7]
MYYLVGLAIILAIFFLLIILKGKPGIFNVNLASRNIDNTDRQRIVSLWNKVEELISLGKPSQLNEAVITADKVVDYVLKKLYPMEEVSVERYKNAKIFFLEKQDYDDLWYAHKVRNELVHNLEFELPHAQAVEVINKFEKSLKIIIKDLKI